MESGASSSAGAVKVMPSPETFNATVTVSSADDAVPVQYSAAQPSSPSRENFVTLTSDAKGSDPLCASMANASSTRVRRLAPAGLGVGLCDAAPSPGGRRWPAGDEGVPSPGASRRPLPSGEGTEVNPGLTMYELMAPGKALVKSARCGSRRTW